MDEFARRDSEDRRAYIEEAAARRDLTPVIIEKDFWVCWTLRRLVTAPELANHVTFKGGTSLSKAYGLIQRFSEDIDLTIRRSVPSFDKVPSPMESDISGKERKRRTLALKAAARAYVASVAMPVLASAIEKALGSAKGWSLVPDPADPDQQTLLFHYPRADRARDDSQSAYIKPRIKLEFGARGDPEPFEPRSIQPISPSISPKSWRTLRRWSTRSASSGPSGKRQPSFTRFTTGGSSGMECPAIITTWRCCIGPASPIGRCCSPPCWRASCATRA